MITLSPWIIYYLMMSDNILNMLLVAGLIFVLISFAWFVFTFPLEIDGITTIKNDYSYGRARDDDKTGIEKKELAGCIRRWVIQRRVAVSAMLFGGILVVLSQTLPDKKTVMTMLAINQPNRIEFINNLPPYLLNVFVEVYSGKDAKVDVTK